jgi:hypothetical protein
VVAYLDGRRLKGYIHDFSAQDGHFHIFSEQDTELREGADVQMKDLKAIFFAQDFAGNGEYMEPQILSSQNQGRKLEVSFRDGEKLEGTADGYDPQRIGFFLVPVDPRSNNLRVFVITKNATQVRWL